MITSSKQQAVLPSVLHHRPYFASLINESISRLYRNFCREFLCYFYTRLRNFLSNSCWLCVVELILRANPQNKVRFFKNFSMRERDIYFFYNEKISCKNPFCISLNDSFTLFLCQIFHFFYVFRSPAVIVLFNF